GAGLAGAAAGQEGGADGRAQVDTSMLVEERVLGGKRGVDQVLGDLAQRHDSPFATVRVVKLPQELTLAVEDLGGLETGMVADVAQRWQIAREHGVASCGALEENEDAQEAHADQRDQEAGADHQWRPQATGSTGPVAIVL